MFAANVILLVERHCLGGRNLAHLAGPADLAAAVVVRHVRRGQKLLHQPPDGIRSRCASAAPPSPRRAPCRTRAGRRRPAGRSPATPKAPAGSPASTRSTAVSSRPVSAFKPCAPFASATSVNWLGITYLSASACASRNAFFSSASFLLVASHRLQVLGLVGVVGRLHFFQRRPSPPHNLSSRSGSSP